MANDNVSAILALKAGGSGGGSEYAVLYTEQELTDLQKAQARANIGAVGRTNADFAEGIEMTVQASNDTVGDSILFYVDTMAAGESAVMLEGDQSNQVVLRGLASPSAPGDAVNKRYADGFKVTDLVSTSITLDLAADNTIYEYGELTALTVTAIANPGCFIIRFTSGATATTTNFPASMIFPSAFAAEANTRYEINVSDGYALAVGWPVSSP